MICAPSEDSDQPRHPPSLIRVFVVHMKKHWVLIYPLSALRRLWSDWVGAQADLSLRWAHRSFCWFCHEAAQMPNKCDTNDFGRLLEASITSFETRFVSTRLVKIAEKPCLVCKKQKTCTQTKDIDGIFNGDSAKCNLEIHKIGNMSQSL